MATATTTAAASATTSPIATPSNANDNNGSSNKSFLFFVALGFGVVFTNLWIIVGIKYCFRYNRRNRQRALGENASPLEMLANPRPSRRRREKKLMTIEQANEKFPLMKYKVWRAQRAAIGLFTEGGVAVPPSEEKTNLPGSGVTERDGQDHLTTLNLAQQQHAETNNVRFVSDDTRLASSPPPINQVTLKDEKDNVNVTTEATHDDEVDSDNEDDPIHATTPVNVAAVPGDTCAICIDNIEDDDDIRGLTCGHAFHAACIDPWLTSRRACCPLCKADYYVPQPIDTTRQSTTRPLPPHEVYLGVPRNGMPFRMIHIGRYRTGGEQVEPTTTSTTSRPTTQNSNRTWRTRMLQLPRLQRSPAIPAPDSTPHMIQRFDGQHVDSVTPSDLESGVVRPHQEHEQQQQRPT